MFKQVASVDVDYVLLTPANVPAAASPVTDAELQQAYTQFVEAQKDNVAPLVKHILITTDARTDAEAKKRAEASMADKASDISYTVAATELARAMAQIRALQKIKKQLK